MYPFFHLAIPLILFEIPKVQERFNINRLALIIGSILPDLIDKPLSILGLGSGRGYAHTLLFVGVVYIITLLVSKKNWMVSNGLLIGLGFHLVMDLPEVPLFYPFVYYDFIYIKTPVEFWFYRLLGNPGIMITELLGLGSLIYIGINKRLYVKKNLISFLINSTATEENDR
ncbi:MAG: metal-dependent hydrolase [Promethearchaeota archaeon]